MSEKWRYLTYWCKESTPANSCECMFPKALLIEAAMSPGLSAMRLSLSESPVKFLRTLYFKQHLRFAVELLHKSQIPLIDTSDPPVSKSNVRRFGVFSLSLSQILPFPLLSSAITKGQRETVRPQHLNPADMSATSAPSHGTKSSPGHPFWLKIKIKVHSVKPNHIHIL